MEVILYDPIKYLCTLSLASCDTLYPMADSNIWTSQRRAQSPHQLVQILIFVKHLLPVSSDDFFLLLSKVSFVRRL